MRTQTKDIKKLNNIIKGLVEEYGYRGYIVAVVKDDEDEEDKSFIAVMGHNVLLEEAKSIAGRLTNLANGEDTEDDDTTETLAREVTIGVRPPRLKKAKSSKPTPDPKKELEELAGMVDELLNLLSKYKDGKSK